jgi:hypothetical protein
MVLTPKQMYERERYLKRKAEKEAERQRKNDENKRSRTVEQSPASLSINSSSTTPLSLSEPTKKKAGRPKLNEKRVYESERKRKLDKLNSLSSDDRQLLKKKEKIESAKRSLTYRQSIKIKYLEEELKKIKKEKDQVLNIPSTPELKKYMENNGNFITEGSDALSKSELKSIYPAVVAQVEKHKSLGDILLILLTKNY